jgi:hypothetical protein
MPRPGNGPSPLHHTGRAVAGPHQTVPTFTTDRSTEELPNFAPAARPGYAVDLPRGHRGDGASHRGAHPNSTSPSGLSAIPAHIHQVRAGGGIKRLYMLVPRVHLSVTLAEPGPSGCTNPSRRCRGRFPPSRAFPRSGCLQLHAHCYDSRRVKVSHPHSIDSASWRTLPFHQGPRTSSTSPLYSNTRTAVSGAVGLHLMRYGSVPADPCQLLLDDHVVLSRRSHGRCRRDRWVVAGGCATQGRVAVGLLRRLPHEGRSRAGAG